MLTVKQIAEELGVSKSTARRYLQKINAVPSESVHESVHGTVSKQKEYRYPETVLDDINAILKGNSENNGSVHKKDESVHEPVHNAVYETLMEQLKTKDTQIAELQKALDQEQQLHAMAENRLKLLEDKSEQETPAPEPEKKSWWSRIFNRN